MIMKMYGATGIPGTLLNTRHDVERPDRLMMAISIAGEL
jgi:hypothetical protein